MNRRLILLPVLVLAAFLAWRHFSAPVGDRAIISGELEAVRRAAQNGNVNGILSRLDRGFRIQGASKSEIRTQLVAFFFQNGNIRLDLAGVNVKVEGDSAVSDGSYTARWKSDMGSPEQVRSGRFSARWRKVDGQWKITELPGVESLGAP